MALIWNKLHEFPHWTSERLLECNVPHAFVSRCIDATAIDQDVTAKLLRLTQMPRRMLFVSSQNHGTQCCHTQHYTETHPRPTADALATNHKSQAIVIRTADCVPLLAASKDGSWVMAIHAGWRGLTAGIIQKSLLTAPVNISQLRIAIGPCIGSQSMAFEVSQDIADIFVEKGFAPAIRDSLTAQKKPAIDLAEAARLACLQIHVNDKAIDANPLCTYSNTDILFSYRHETSHLQMPTGRLASIIGPYHG